MTDRKPFLEMPVGDYVSFEVKRDWRDTCREMREKYEAKIASDAETIAALESELAARRASDEDVRELLRFETGGDGDVIEEAVLDRLLSAPWLKKGGG